MLQAVAADIKHTNNIKRALRRLPVFLENQSGLPRFAGALCAATSLNNSTSPLLSPHKLNWFFPCTPFVSVCSLPTPLSDFFSWPINIECSGYLPPCGPSINVEIIRMRAHDSWQQQTFLRTSSSPVDVNYPFRKVQAWAWDAHALSLGTLATNLMCISGNISVVAVFQKSAGWPAVSRHKDQKHTKFQELCTKVLRQ